MNIFTSGLKTNFVSIIPTMRSPQKMQFHHSSTSPLNDLIQNKVFATHNPNRKFNNPNLFNQNTHGENFPSSYKKISHFEVPQNKEVEKQEENSSGMISEDLEKTNFGGEIAVVEQPKHNCVSSRKRTRKTKNRRKIPDKHNSKRRVVNEMMDMELGNDLVADISLQSNDDQDMDEHHPNTIKLCDLLLLPNHSSPMGVPIVNISMESPKMQGQACLAFSISPPTIRQRNLSTTESEDSFIVFDSGTDEECDFSEDAGTDSDECSDEDNEAESDSDSPGSVVPTKKVRFANDKELCEVHPMVQWSFAYQAARKGPWEIYARDRERFKNRIQHVNEKIGHCFEPEHRQKMYNQRFLEKNNESSKETSDKGGE